MEKLIRQFRPIGSLGKGCGEHAECPILKDIIFLIIRVVFSGLGTRKPKHPSGHPPVFMGSNFSSTPWGGGLNKPLMVNNTFGGNGLKIKDFNNHGILIKTIMEAFKHLQYNGFRKNTLIYI